MSRNRRLRCVFAVLLGWALLAGTFQSAAAPAAARVAAAPTAAVTPAAVPGVTPAAVPGVTPAAVPGVTPAAAPSAAPAPAEAGAARPGAVFAVSAVPAGPACAPGSPGRDGVPALPGRAASDQAQVQAPPARPGPEVAAASRAIAVRVLVRGPGQSAPSPLELSVMRV
ncbi:hypothetical protein [Streptomyces sp. NPDC058401]|uniref:hypothetical protein n=1 Tax=Streptomyces sp. NPDC058401 TaxID=3346480 RepID=UPI00364DF710